LSAVLTRSLKRFGSVNIDSIFYRGWFITLTATPVRLRIDVPFRSTIELRRDEITSLKRLLIFFTTGIEIVHTRPDLPSELWFIPSFRTRHTLVLLEELGYPVRLTID
jgi:hypothetical protein